VKRERERERERERKKERERERERERRERGWRRKRRNLVTPSMEKWVSVGQYGSSPTNPVPSSSRISMLGQFPTKASRDLVTPASINMPELCATESGRRLGVGGVGNVVIPPVSPMLFMFKTCMFLLSKYGIPPVTRPGISLTM
jgi:hypothetical protein